MDRRLDYFRLFVKLNLYSCYSFKWILWIFQTVSGKLQKVLSWSHHTVLSKPNGNGDLKSCDTVATI